MIDAYKRASGDDKRNMMSALTRERRGLFGGVTLVYTGIGSNRRFQTPIRPGFHQSRHIADEIIANFIRHKRRAGAGGEYDHGAQT